MTTPAELATPVPALISDSTVPFTDGHVRIVSAELVNAREDGVTLRVRFVVEGRSPDQYDFEVDETWGFDSTQDVIDQLRIDLAEHVHTHPQ